MKKLFILIGVVASLILTSPQALGAYNVVSKLFPRTEPYTNFGDYFAGALLPYIIIIASVGAVLMIAIAGFKYVTSGGSPDAVNESKSYIIGAIVGIAVIVFAMAFVNIFFGEDEFKNITANTKKIEDINTGAPAGGTGGAGGSSAGGTAGEANSSSKPSADNSESGIAEITCPAEVINYQTHGFYATQENTDTAYIYLTNTSADSKYRYRFYFSDDDEANIFDDSLGLKKSLDHYDYLGNPQHWDYIAVDQNTYPYVKAFMWTDAPNDQNPFCLNSKKPITITETPLLRQEPRSLPI